MKKDIRLLFFVFLLVSGKLFAQPYGFEWIKPYQPYYKFKIAQTGVYRLDSALLVSAGVNLTGLHPQRLQVFKNGVEQSVFIHGQNDGVFNSSDFIELYAEANDGELDKELYVSSTAQPHPWYSLITDTAAFFLTVLPDTSSIQGKRLSPFFENNYGSYTPENYFMHEEKYFRPEEYIDGINLLVSGEKYNSSEYTDGEGWAAQRIGLGGIQTYTVNTPFPYASGPLPSIEIKVIGVSDYYFGSPPVNHHVQMHIAPAEAPTFTLVKDFLYKGYISQKYNGVINYSQIGTAQTLVRMSVVNDLLVGSDFNSLSYVKFTYARQYNLGGGNNLKFKVAHNHGGLRSYLLFSNYGNGSLTRPVLYDFANNRRVMATYDAGACKAIVENNGTANQMVVFDSSSIINVSILKPVNFKIIDPASAYDFILVTHPLLNNAATQYENFRKQRFNVLKVYSEELYDYYFYGNTHPLALRRLSKHLVQQASTPPKFMLLAGKGFQSSLLRTQKYYDGNLVPALGVPASDHLISAGIDGNGFYAEIPTGRIAAINDQQLLNYLQKLQFYETSPDSIQSWRKNILHLSGGENEFEQDQFKGVMQGYTGVIQGKNFGASVSAYHKSTTDPQQVNLRDALMQIINNGINMMTFLGHGSATVLDINFGSLAELNNANKYPLFYFNGCNVGNPSDVDPVTEVDFYGRDFICAANKGAIGWLAHSNLTLTSNLFSQMTGFYQQFTNINYGKPVGELVMEATKSLPGGDPVTRMHNMQLTYQGDPAVRIYSPSHPDYKIASNDLYLTPGDVNAKMDSFAVAVIVNNIGRATDDTVRIQVSRTYPNNSKYVYPVYEFKRVFNKDTAYLWIKGNDPAAVGLNSFEVSLDPLNMVSEINETNNTAILSVFIPGSGVKTLFPYNYAIVNRDTVELVAQNNNLFAKNAEYIFELDTSPTFTSLMYRTSGIVTAGTIAKWKVVLPQTDTLVYFWRSRLNLPVNQGGGWSEASFTYLKNGFGGWSQSHFTQYSNAASVEHLILDTINKKTAFDLFEQDLIIQNKRWSHPGMGIQAPYLMNSGSFNCGLFASNGGIICILFDARSLKPHENPRYPFNCSYVPSSGQFYYPFITSNPAGEAEFRAFLDSVSPGTYIAAFSFYNAGQEGWQQSTRDRLAQFGSVKAANIRSFYSAFSLIGKKGQAPGLAIEDTIFNDQFNTRNDADSVLLTLKNNLIGVRPLGNLLSDKIGPASSWDHLFFHFKSEENQLTDFTQVSVYAVDQNEKDSLVYSGISLSGFNLTGLNASTYPYIRLKLEVVDSVYRTPNQFGRWMVTYLPPAEGTLNPEIAYAFHDTILEQGDSLKFRIAFQNISATAFDSLPVSLRIIDANRIEQYSSTAKLNGLAGGEYWVYETAVPTYNMEGPQQFTFSVNGLRQQPELQFANNFLNMPFVVNVDKRNPLLDVTFDGYRIMNGDFVSPTPVIRITSKDENQFRLQQDTSTFSVFLKRPGNSSFELVPMESAQIRFIPASAGQNTAMVEFAPNRLEDGIYTLKVQARDASGNLSGKSAYEIDFNVVNESTITSFFPYPNPGTTNIRFVFTLTGSSTPEDLLVRITTLSGKIVREVTRSEFGAIKIGNNISEFAWDGTDSYGDRLANGVYLYQVFSRIGGKTIKKRDTAADQFVLHNTGKIYLMK